MEIVKEVSRWGNSAGILLPKEWFGNRVKVILIENSLDIKKEVIKILFPYLEDIYGVYLVGSYARNEQEADSDIDIIAISRKTRKEIKSGKYNISISTLDGIKKTLKSYPELILPRLYEAKPIINPGLLEELKSIKIKISLFDKFITDTKKILKINKDLLNLESNEKSSKSSSIIYSLVLRLRGLFLIKCLLKKQEYSKKSFESYLEQALTKEEFSKAYSIYRAEKNKSKKSTEIETKTIKKLIVFLENELKNF